MRNAATRNAAKCLSGTMFYEGIKEVTSARLFRALLCPLPEVELEFLGGVNSFLNEYGVHGIDRGVETIFASKFVHRFFKADEGLTSRNSFRVALKWNRCHKHLVKGIFHVVRTCCQAPTLMLA